MGGRGSGSSGGGGGGGLPPSAILNTADLVSRRETRTGEVDNVLTVARDIADEYGVRVNQFQTAEIAKRYDHVMGYYDPSSGNIAINEKYFDNAALNEAMDRTYKNGYHPSRGSKSGAEALAAHEMGHLVADSAEQRTGVTQSSVVKSARKAAGYRNVGQLQRAISGYATKNYHETIAEAFTDVYCNGSRASKASKAVVSELNKLYGK